MKVGENLDETLLTCDGNLDGILMKVDEILEKTMKIVVNNLNEDLENRIKQF